MTQEQMDQAVGFFTMGFGVAIWLIVALVVITLRSWGGDDE